MASASSTVIVPAAVSAVEAPAPATAFGGFVQGSISSCCTEPSEWVYADDRHPSIVSCALMHATALCHIAFDKQTAPCKIKNLEERQHAGNCAAVQVGIRATSAAPTPHDHEAGSTKHQTEITALRLQYMWNY